MHGPFFISEKILCLEKQLEKSKEGTDPVKKQY